MALVIFDFYESWRYRARPTFKYDIYVPMISIAHATLNSHKLADCKRYKDGHYYKHSNSQYLDECRS